MNAAGRNHTKVKFDAKKKVFQTARTALLARYKSGEAEWKGNLKDTFNVMVDAAAE